MKRMILLCFMAVSCMILAAPASELYAQAQSSPANTTPAITAAAAPASTLNPSVLPVFSSAGTTVPVTQGAGSDNNGYISFKGYIFKVHRGDDPAIIESNFLSNATAIRDFNYGTEFAPKIEGGYNGASGWGFRVSYFYTHQKATVSVVAPAGTPFILSPRPLNVTFTGAADVGTTATFNERLRIHYFDGEGSYKWKGTNYSALISAGIRIAPTRQTYTVNDTFGARPEDLNYTQKRTGIGPTIALDLRHRLGGSNFWITGQGRFSLLFGKIKETANYIVPSFTLTATRNNSRTTPVIEGEVGLEYSKKFGSGNEFFVNASFAAQEWFKLVNVVPTPAIGSNAFTALDNPASPATRKGDIGLIGGSFSFGFRF